MASTRRPQGSSRTGNAGNGPGRPNGGGTTGTKPASGGPRRLGGNEPARKPAAGAQRRYDRARKKSNTNKYLGWGGVAVVVAVVLALVLVNVTGGSSPKTSSSAVSGADRHPAAASAAEVKAITTIPAAVFNSVGTAGQPAAFQVTAKQPPLTLNGKARFVYEGGEFCPYCAVTRYAMVAALSRFGTFSGLKKTASGPNDGDIPTFSFIGSHYSSPYVAFTPYEAFDRLQNPLQPVPAAVQKLDLTDYVKPNASQPSSFANGLWTSPGIPFLDVGNKYVVAGASAGLNTVVSSGVLFNGGPGRQAIANAIHSPNSTTGKAIQADQFIAEANYITAAICNVNGGKPGSVCATPGVKAAMTTLATVKPVS
jgi:hypothetical protein